MILQSVLIYGFLCCVPVVYGIGIKKLMYASYGVRYLVLSLIKSVCTASLSVLASWLITQYALAPYSIASLFPFFAAIVTFCISFAFERIMYLCFKVEIGEFDIALLSVILAISEGFGLGSALLTALISVLSFYFLYPLIAAIRRRLTLTNAEGSFSDTIMVVITLALIACGFYGWNLSWFNPGIFR